MRFQWSVVPFEPSTSTTGIEGLALEREPGRTCTIEKVAVEQCPGVSRHKVSDFSAAWISTRNVRIQGPERGPWRHRGKHHPPSKGLVSMVQAKLERPASPRGEVLASGIVDGASTVPVSPGLDGLTRSRSRCRSRRSSAAWSRASTSTSLAVVSTATAAGACRADRGSEAQGGKGRIRRQGPLRPVRARRSAPCRTASSSP